MADHDPLKVETRKPLTPKQKAQMFLRHGGKCCVCGQKINGVSEAWDEHINPLWLSGDNNAENRAPAHVKCARKKTSYEAKVRKKVRSVGLKHMGAKKKSSRPMPGSRDSKWKRRLDGTVVRRDK